MNLARAIEQAHAANEQKISAGVPRVSEQLNADELQALSVFTRFCSLNGLRNCPANPRVVATWIRSEKGTDPHKIAPTLAAIERLHDYHGLANPIATAPVRAELARILEIETPRSWSKAEQLMFAALPAEIRAVISRREQQREKELRRCQNLAADLKRQAEKPATTEGTKVTIRKRNDSVKPGKGIDGAEGENYTKDHAFNDVDFGYAGNDKNERSHAGEYTSNSAGLTRTSGFEHGSVSRQIWQDVEANQNPGGEFDTTGAIRSGTSRSQKS